MRCNGLTLCTDEIGELRRRENEMQVEPDWEIDAFMKASVRHGKRHNIRTDYTLRLLGLEVLHPSIACGCFILPNLTCFS